MSERTGKDTGDAIAIKRVPRAVDERNSIRSAACEALSTLSRKRPLLRSELEQMASDLLDKLELDRGYLGFTMVAIDNEFWRNQYAAVPPERRLLLLPHCLRDSADCRGTYDEVGLHCLGCGRCAVGGIESEAKKLGYRVLVAEGTPAVVRYVLRGDADAILGVACLDSMERAFEHVAEMGIPHQAAPLLCDGCIDTEAEIDLVRELMLLQSGPATSRTRGVVPILRETWDIFKDDEFDRLLAPVMRTPDAKPGRLSAGEEAFDSTESIAIDWLRSGGKRFRPFITLAASAVMSRGTEALDPTADLSDLFGDAALRVAIAIETLHKASLVHDDIEDDDNVRYGRATLHERHGIPIAINVGDYLVGLGYRLIARGSGELGADSISDIIASLSEAHLRLCRGQGAELFLRRVPPADWEADRIQTVYALKTAPAFEAALIAGMRMAGPVQPYADTIRRYSRFLGVAYQVRNDLDEWKPADPEKGVKESLRELDPSRPTILRAFAQKLLDRAALARLERIESSSAEPDLKRADARVLFENAGVFERARAMVARCRERAVEQADASGHEALSELMRFIIETVL